MRALWIVSAVVTLSACRKDDDSSPSGDDGTTDGTTLVDADGDGFDESVDCDDEDASINPDAEEVCDGADNNCDGYIDEDVLETWYLDNDGDSFGSAISAVEACTAPDGYVADGGDCDDFDETTYPDAAERCDEVDNDCDNEVDEDVQDVWYVDADGDGFGNAEQSIDSCDPPGGFVENNIDCDDLEPLSYPGNTEVCDGIDNDCDTNIDEDVLLTFYTDADGDGYGVEELPVEACEESGLSAVFGDCDDTNLAISPAAAELCDSVDNDCDGATDEDDALDAATFYADSDSDGYGDAAATTTACAAPSGYVDNDEDCADGDGAINPDAAEICDSVDNDCDGVTDLVDDDSDGFLAAACGGGDCNDADATINPGATEVWYDGTDQDCDSGSDFDQDGDGFDSDAFGGTDCDDTAATTYVGATDAWYDGVDADCAGNSDYDQDADGYDSDAFGGTDCADTNASINPGATDTPYDGIDSDCSGNNDYDADGDGYLASSAGGSDCDDTSAAINPGATEIWYDGTDQDCDGNDDDQDGDGYGVDSLGGQDCNDGDATISPDATEVCGDGIDNNCDGLNSCTYAGDDTADVADLIWTGSNAGDQLGGPVRAVGDLDSDGETDIALSARGYGAGSEGAVYLVDGPYTAGTYDIETVASARIEGANAGDTVFGVNGISDWDGDGFHDLVVASQRSDANGTDSGAVHIFLGGASGNLLTSDADITLAGEAAGDRSAVVAGIGDVDNDGLPDFLVSSNRYDSFAGVVYLVTGNSVSADDTLDNSTAVFYGADPANQFGGGIAGAGDQDGDGIADFMVGVPRDDTTDTDAGGIAIFLGQSGLSGTFSSADADAFFAGPAINHQAGYGIGAAGDHNGDGYEDVLISSTRDDLGGNASGAVYLLAGPLTADGTMANATLAVIAGEVANDRMAASATGDFDGDSELDVVAASRNNDSTTGAAYVFFGPLSGTYGAASADGIVRGEAAGDGLGAPVSAPGDVDGNGLDDLLLGARTSDNGGVDAGTAYLFLSQGI